MRGRRRGAALLAAGALALTACSGGDDEAAAGGGGEAVADVAAAEKFLEPWTGTGDKDVLIDEPLEAPVAEGTTVVYLDVGTPVSAVMWENLQAPAELLGIELERVEVGRDAQSINTAMNTVVELAPDGVINITLDPIFFEPQIEQFDALGIPIASGSVMTTVEHGLPEAFNGPEWMKTNGAVLAATAVQRSGGAGEYVFYNVPEFPFSALELEGARAKMAELCPECTLRVVDIPIAELGSTASDRVVSDLQANPQTEYFIAAVDEVQIGLPQKLGLAGLAVDGIGMWTAPPNYEQIIAGDQDASLSVDLNLMMWTVLDQLLREIGGQEYEWPDVQTRAATLSHVTHQENAPEDPVVGYVSIPDYQERFAALWLAD
ncbi:sugar ABC transporter substrate-binding protein [Myceligenerans pegani]|uniref:Substrate-binding domain-containing protein n=1 Tax=Myceligenerans pegani TaxID=2776917 RepID=A0ABR9N5R2_9MICO|nr:substrate-binding domain-containing protein [Myceligenerans sp. TRM 65318]MBE1878999.1 substrate-binding domain-containing protein [Myceligenerans sp. TRM 65318]MBE3021270.1 substrate-binding domain-containing protein [Myceligenerans sp. TRM 65318]